MGQTETVRLGKVVHQKGELPVRRDPVDPLKIELLGPGDTHPRHPAGIGIGEIDGAITGHHDIVGAVEFLAPVMGGENGRGPVMLEPGHPAGAMLAGEEPPLPVIGVAVGEIAVFPKQGDMVVLVFCKEADAHDIAEDERLLPGVPDRPLQETETRCDTLQPTAFSNDICHPAVVLLYRKIHTVSKLNTYALHLSKTLAAPGHPS